MADVGQKKCYVVFTVTSRGPDLFKMGERKHRPRDVRAKRDWELDLESVTEMHVTKPLV